jgi:hypothetical protein
MHAMRCVRIVLTVAAAAIAAGAPAANAVRAPTPEEAAAIADTLGQPASCLDIKVTTAKDADAGYARITYTDGPDCPEGDGFVTANTAGPSPGIWAEGFADAEGTGYCEDVDVPPGVGRDLGICEPRLRHTFLPGYIQHALTYRPSRIPQGAHGYYRSLRWSSWTRTSARGRGTFDYADRYEQFRVRVNIRLYRPAICDDGERVFTRRKVTAVRGADRRRIRFDTKYRATAGCPEDTAG